MVIVDATVVGGRERAVKGVRYVWGECVWVCVGGLCAGVWGRERLCAGVYGEENVCVGEGEEEGRRCERGGREGGMK